MLQIFFSLQVRNQTNQTFYIPNLIQKMPPDRPTKPALPRPYPAPVKR